MEPYSCKITNVSFDPEWKMADWEDLSTNRGDGIVFGVGRGINVKFSDSTTNFAQIDHNVITSYCQCHEKHAIDMEDVAFACERAIWHQKEVEHDIHMQTLKHTAVAIGGLVVVALAAYGIYRAERWFQKALLCIERCRRIDAAKQKGGAK